jgi:hypothetical protein
MAMTYFRVLSQYGEAEKSYKKPQSVYALLWYRDT